MHPEPHEELRVASFRDLDAATLYALLQLRVDVFVVEQECAYPELDGRDHEPATLHLWLADDGRRSRTCGFSTTVTTRGSGGSARTRRIAARACRPAAGRGAGADRCAPLRVGRPGPPRALLRQVSAGRQDRTANSPHAPLTRSPRATKRPRSTGGARYGRAATNSVTERRRPV